MFTSIHLEPCPLMALSPVLTPHYRLRLRLRRSFLRAHSPIQVQPPLLKYSSPVSSQPHISRASLESQFIVNLVSHWVFLPQETLFPPCDERHLPISTKPAVPLILQPPPPPIPDLSTEQLNIATS